MLDASERTSDAASSLDMHTPSRTLAKGHQENAAQARDSGAPAMAPALRCPVTGRGQVPSDGLMGESVPWSSASKPSGMEPHRAELPGLTNSSLSAGSLHQAPHRKNECELCC